MAFIRLSLENFRNLDRIELAPAPGMVMICGDNGAGKTNLLEALSLFAPGRGLRRAVLADMIRDRHADSPQSGTEGGFAVFGEWETAQNTNSASLAIGTGIAAERPNRRQLLIDGAETPLARLAHCLSILWLTPAMDRLFVEGAANRRAFFDRLVLALEPSHALHSSRYRNAVRERSHLLAESNGSSNGYDRHWLGIVEEQIGEHGAAIDRARLACLQRLSDHTQAPEKDLEQSVGQAPAHASDFPSFRLALTDSEGNAHTTPRSAEDIARALADRRSLDARMGRASYGPHRDDIQVWHRESGQSAARCSTGEQKILLLALLLAQADAVAHHRQTRPLLLLDEVAAHLDPIRRTALYARLQAAGGQIWLTATEAALFDGCHGTRYHVENGRVSLM